MTINSALRVAKILELTKFYNKKIKQLSDEPYESVLGSEWIDNGEDSRELKLLIAKHCRGKLQELKEELDKL